MTNTPDDTTTTTTATVPHWIDGARVEGVGCRFPSYMAHFCHLAIHRPGPSLDRTVGARWGFAYDASHRGA